MKRIAAAVLLTVVAAVAAAATPTPTQTPTPTPLPSNISPWRRFTVGDTLNTVVGGAVLASATKIYPAFLVTHVSGTAEVDTIVLPYPDFKGVIVLVPDGNFTTGTSGNIAKASTAVTGQALFMVYDGTSWYPSY